MQLDLFSETKSLESGKENDGGVRIGSDCRKEWGVLCPDFPLVFLWFYSAQVQIVQSREREVGSWCPPPGLPYLSDQPSSLLPPSCPFLAQVQLSPFGFWKEKLGVISVGGGGMYSNHSGKLNIV